jgi:hypothetical protein
MTCSDDEVPRPVGFVPALLELSCLECGLAQLVATPPEWIRGDPYTCPRCGVQSWALAPPKLVGENQPPAEEPTEPAKPRVIYRSSSPAMPEI